jgi:hypothetical protein
MRKTRGGRSSIKNKKKLTEEWSCLTRRRQGRKKSSGVFPSSNKREK